MHAYYTHFMITKHDDLLGTLVHDVAHLLRLDIDRRVRDHNLTRVKWLALGIVAVRPGLTQAELAAELELGTAAVGRLVDRLADRGFIVRKADPQDRRAYRLMTTPEAAGLLKTLRATAAKLRREALEGLSDKEISTLNSGLKKLKENLQRSLAKQAAPA